MAKEKSPLVEGNKYGYLTFLGNSRMEGGKRLADFHCDCGEQVTKCYNDVKRILKKGTVQPCCSRTCSAARLQYGKDYTGGRYGMLEVVEKLDETKGTSFLYKCKCDCGNEVKLISNEFAGKSGNRSCGCQLNKGTPKDITGKKSHKLTAIRSTGEKSNNGDYLWLFQCDCGNTYVTTIGNFNSGHTKSCGCAIKDSWKSREDYHGMSKTTEYKSWCKIKERCYNENDQEYPHYGAVGITMSDDWRNDFKQFLADMGRKPDDGQWYTVDRIDNTKGYEKANCRWASQKEQARNKLGLQTNNRSGVKGVHWDEKSPGNLYAKATWRGFDGIQHGKVFSVKVYGEELAFFLACEYRQHQIELLNLQGAGYSEQHLMNEHHGRW